MSTQQVVKEISVLELKKNLDDKSEFLVLDVREPHELKICSLQQAVHIPLGDLRFRLHELDNYKNKEIVVYCRSGRRSAMACLFMQDNGFLYVKNLAGGILAWSDQIDPSLQKY